MRFLVEQARKSLMDQSWNIEEVTKIWRNFHVTLTFTNHKWEILSTFFVFLEKPELKNTNATFQHFWLHCAQRLFIFAYNSDSFLCVNLKVICKREKTFLDMFYVP